MALHTVAESLEASACYYTERTTKNAEFMLDFCCMGRETHEMLLAVESEWSTDAKKVIDDDFQKLVYIRSRYRMVIFRAEPKEVHQRAKAFLCEFQGHLVGDSYIFAWIDWEGKVSGWKIMVEPNNQIVGPILIQRSVPDNQYHDVT